MSMGGREPAQQLDTRPQALSRGQGGRTVLFVAGGWALFSAYRIWLAVVTYPFVWKDSLAYRAVSTHGYTSSQLWAGSRAPLTPLLLKLTHQYAHYTVAQAVIGAVAWGILALTACRLVPDGWRGVIVGWAVLGFATTPLVIQWDRSVLSESPSLSALALICAAGLWLVWRFSWVRLAVMGIAVLAYVGARDADIWSVGVVGIAMVMVGLFKTMSGAATGPGSVFEVLRAQGRNALGWLMTGVVLLSVALVSGWAAGASHRNVVNIEEAFEVRVFAFPDRVAWFSAHGMPDAVQIDSLAVATPASAHSAKVVVPDLAEAQWRSLHTWFERDGELAYAWFLVTHPGYTLGAPFASPPMTFNNLSGNLANYGELGSHPLNVLGTIIDPNRFVVMVLAVVATIVAWRRMILGRHDWRFLAAFTFVGVTSMLLAWHGEGREVTRHLVEGMVEVRLGVLLLLLTALLGEKRRLPGPAVGTTGPTSRHPDLPLLRSEADQQAGPTRREPRVVHP
ncbi:MAG TPA: hypothetical protein VEH82_04890 [Acidimicrobiales bacterium]|nr:hypothetical protein [Acidimicrobiales bacterium]